VSSVAVDAGSVVLTRFVIVSAFVIARGWHRSDQMRPGRSRSRVGDMIRDRDALHAGSRCAGGQGR
jgi:hypothetical protein